MIERVHRANPPLSFLKGHIIFRSAVIAVLHHICHINGDISIPPLIVRHPPQLPARLPGQQEPLIHDTEVGGKAKEEGRERLKLNFSWLFRGLLRGDDLRGAGSFKVTAGVLGGELCATQTALKVDLCFSPDLGMEPDAGPDVICCLLTQK